ncbi:hypothetical protein ASF35_16440 [Aeromicrobium sp. Leaf291]|nr:hypothetical protein ASF35_16440 [Aeromicrobium sp. Leaf291]
MGANRRYGDRSPLPAHLQRGPERVHHVWVGQDDGPPWAGLLVAWERRPDGWWAQVAAVSPDDELTLRWEPAGRVSPAG